METMAGPAIDTQVLVILGAAFGAMFVTLTTMMFTFIRLHHRENIETRELIAQSTEKFQTQIEQVGEKFQTQIEQSAEKLAADFERRFDKQEAKFDRRFDKQEGKLDKVIVSLSDARERLARIEGHLGVGLPSQTEPESNGDTSEAA